MPRNKWRWILALTLALALVAAACGGDDDDAGDDTATTQAATDDGADAGGDAGGDGDVLKIAFVHVGPVADKGWSWAHDQGAQYVKAQLGDAVEITTLESIPEGSDSQRVFEDLAADGHGLIFGTSFGYMEPMLAAMREHTQPELWASVRRGPWQLGDDLGIIGGAAKVFADAEIN